MSEEKEVKKPHLSRREFLKDAGLIVGGATIGSIALASACNNDTTTVAGNTVTTTVTQTVGTVTVPAGTTTITQPGSTSVVTVTPDDPSLGDKSRINLTVNGRAYNLTVPNHLSLAWILREELGLFGTKIGCDMGQCGACTILVDDVAIYSCVMLACEADGKKVTTVEGLSDGITLSPIQQKFYDKEAVQCGYCTPGFLMAAEGLLKANSNPTEDDVRLALSGHLCMCQNFRKTISAVIGGV
ncbi:MAG: (2Fe-2S)-binding protein [Dehalococcoidia bacterium]|nr:(2Fe-2S)-binding protein [Dehalococcoidia bacterium]MCL2150064.1 (2Fe-2S)-binding protein [Dehalococcoidia bacterium]